MRVQLEFPQIKKEFLKNYYFNGLIQPLLIYDYYISLFKKKLYQKKNNNYIIKIFNYIHNTSDLVKL